MNKVTIYEVANKANVSLATVSRVLNFPEKVKEETRVRVQKVIDSLGYRPNAIARGLASQKSTTVGVIVSNLARTSIAEMLNGITDNARKYNYNVLLNVTYNIKELERDIWRNMFASQVDGILYISDDIDESRHDFISKAHIPVVLCATPDENNVIPSVSIDYTNATYITTKKMIENKRKNIVFITSSTKRTVSNLQEEGYKKAMNEAKLNFKVIEKSGDLQELLNYYIEVLKSNEIDAAIFSRDSFAVQFMNAARSLGFDIPKDIEVVGSQNTKQSIMSRPTLSTINLPVYDIGASSMELLTNLMNEKDTLEKEVVLDYNFLWRDSTIN